MIRLLTGSQSNRLKLKRLDDVGLADVQSPPMYSPRQSTPNLFFLTSNWTFDQTFLHVSGALLKRSGNDSPVFPQPTER
jgi:hypothetical protein